MLIDKIEPIEIYLDIPCKDGTYPPAPPKRYIDYNNQIINKPMINGHILEGNKTGAELGLSGGGGSDPELANRVTVVEQKQKTDEAKINNLAAQQATDRTATDTKITNLRKYVDNNIPDLEDYYTKAEVNALIPNLNNYYTKTEVNNLLPDMSDYYTKAETYNKTEVNALLPDLSDYYTKAETYNKTEVNSLITNIDEIYIFDGNTMTVAKYELLRNAVLNNKPIYMIYNNVLYPALKAIIDNDGGSEQIIIHTYAKIDEVGDIYYYRRFIFSAVNSTPLITITAIPTMNSLNSKQNVLVSGTNIKTINNTSILGSGDINTNNTRLYDFNRTFSSAINLQPITNGVFPTDQSNGRIDFTLPTELADEWAIAGLVKYSGRYSGNRIPIIIVSSFSMEQQTKLRVSFKIANTVSVQMDSLEGSLLLQRR